MEILTFQLVCLFLEVNNVDPTIPVICFYNGKSKRTDTEVKYVGNKAVIVPLDVQIDCTFD